MVGVPLFGGFASKLYLASSASGTGYLFLIALAISSFLNALYYLPVLFRIYSRSEESADDLDEEKSDASYALSIGCFVAVNIILGVAGIYVMHLLSQGVQIL